MNICEILEIGDLIITELYDSYDVEVVIFVGVTGVLLTNLTTDCIEIHERFIKSLSISSLVYKKSNEKRYMYAMNKLKELMEK